MFFAWLSVKEQALPARINLEKACHIFSEKISVFLAVYTVLSFLRAVYAKRMKVNTKSAASKTQPRAFYTGYGKKRWKMLDNPYNIVYYIIMYHHG